ncbi:MAG: ABC transporter permease, partial [Elusimicrobia bacterium]|nr:ABC transporter permease [Elusimicrobiota bacterium]
MKVIELKNITKTYHLERLDVPVLFGIDLTITRGEFVVIMGHSGSGKSTLLNILGLLDKPSGGSFKIAGIEVSKFTDSELAGLRNHFLGFVFQQFNLLSKFSALENVTLPSVYGAKKDDSAPQRASELLDKVGLSERKTHKPNELSGGQQQRVAIARALINKPLVIFADEPTGNLDTKSTKEIIQILKNLNDSGITIVMVTHEPELAAYATRKILVQDGKIVSDETIKKLPDLKDETTISVFKKKAMSLVRAGDYFAQAVKSIAASKLRSFLSIIGVMIGVASLIAMVAVGTGAKESMQAQLANLGANLLVVWPSPGQRGGISQEGAAVFRIVPENIEDIRYNVEGVANTTGYATGRAQVVYGGRNRNTRLEGVSVTFPYIRNSQPSSGRFFTEYENASRQRVVLLGETVRRELFDDRDALGEYVQINRIAFNVIGILPIRGASGWRDEDDRIVMPINTAMHRVLGTQFVNSMDVQVAEGFDMEEVGERIKERLLFLRRLPLNRTDMITVRNLAEIQETMSAQARVFSHLLFSIAFVSLLVGGIGIMNIMFVSVSERTKEIGLRKALGADNNDILFQFIIESVAICLVGGAIGIALGIGASVAISRIAGWATSITMQSVLVAFLFSAVTGVVFGVWPARKASLL